MWSIRDLHQCATPRPAQRSASRSEVLQPSEFTVKEPVSCSSSISCSALHPSHSISPTQLFLSFLVIRREHFLNKDFLFRSELND
jgi:hypothetical protein